MPLRIPATIYIATINTTGTKRHTLDYLNTDPGNKQLRLLLPIVGQCLIIVMTLYYKDRYYDICVLLNLGS